MIMEKTIKALEAAKKLIDSAQKKRLVAKLGTGGDMLFVSDRNKSKCKNR